MSIRHILSVEYSSLRPIPAEKFSLVPSACVSRLVRDALSRVDDGQALATIRRLRQMSPAAARHLQPKSRAIDQLRFRVLRREGGSDGGGDLGSYLALSYRWQHRPTPLTQPSTLSKGYDGGVHDALQGTLSESDNGANDARQTTERDNDGDGEFQGATTRLPVSETLLQAALDELNPAAGGEGLWFDQGCIRQGSAAEVNSAIGAMDLIYRSARAVVVALDDVVLTKYQCRVLRSFCGTLGNGEVDYDDGNDNDDSTRQRQRQRTTWHSPRLLLTIRSVLIRLVESDYFSRAWCRHEFLMARERIFLVRVFDSVQVSKDLVFRLDDDDLRRMFRAAATPLLFGGRSTDAVGERLSELEAFYLKRQRRFLRYGGSSELGKESNEASKGSNELGKESKKALANDMAQIDGATAEVIQGTGFADCMLAIASIDRLQTAGNPLLPERERTADAAADKMAIMLNGADTSIVLDRLSLARDGDGVHKQLTEDACTWRLLLLSLAQGNPLALCTRGRPLKAGDSRGRPSKTKGSKEHTTSLETNDSYSPKISWLCGMHGKDVADMGNLGGNLPRMFDRWKVRPDPRSEHCAFVDADMVMLRVARQAAGPASARSLRIAKGIVAAAGKLASDAQTGLGVRETLARLIDAGREWVPRARGNVISEKNRLLDAFETLLNRDWTALAEDDHHRLSAAAAGAAGTATREAISHAATTAAATCLWDYAFTITKHNMLPFRPLRNKPRAWRMVWLEGAGGQLAIGFAPNVSMTMATTAKTRRMKKTTAATPTSTTTGTNPATSTTAATAAATSPATPAPTMAPTTTADDILFAVPAAVTQPEYAALARCWVLARRQRTDSGHPERTVPGPEVWELRGKIKLGEELSFDGLAAAAGAAHGKGWQVREMRICAPATLS